ncbi:PEP-CTERM system TPR-repeat protein PrsT [Alteromonas sp. 5E99-2]|uniref:XrtA/PEP-CTERM system TPR-repeat protein PrsT n=1 Tax=Alteromonas sp. 5E99-2 TaxID=2817683 RepID=UPI001A980DF9|nr:XrtA/PEP-CTERM system TPR-repeat protein PrsT [Alteromonas sp. 5E99-2]MBO1256683.1 PEP-CTERM system TPR-repeat protein PrsT [Alteromonas sp. 5E99-2]
MTIITKRLPLVFAIATVLSLTACGEKSSEEYLLAADQFIAANNSQAAILELKNALQVNPQSADARFKLGSIYLDQKRFESAEKELNKALDLGYDITKVMPLISTAYKETGASNALINLSYTKQDLSPVENAKIGYFQLVALVDLNQDDEARKLILELQDLKTNSVYKGLSASYGHILSENYEEALKQVIELRKQSPMNEDVLTLQSRLYIILGQKDNALETMGRLYGLRPDKIEIKFSYLAALMDAKEYQTAKPIADGLLALDDANGILNQFKGTILAEEGRYSDALLHLQKALVNGRDNQIVRLLTGFSAYRIGDYQTAVDNLVVIAESLPSEHVALRLLADSQLKIGQNKEASETLLGLTQTSENDTSLFSQASFQLIQEGNLEAAKEVVAQANDLDKTTEELVRLGLLQLSLNDVSGFIKLEEAVEQAPNSVVTQKALASAYLSAGDYDKASALAEKWKSEQPSAFEPYVLAGELAISSGDFDRARSELERALELSNNDEIVQLSLANLLSAQGKHDDAIESTKAILNEFPESASALTFYYSLSQKNNDTSDAIMRTERALTADSDSLKLRLLLARMQFANADVSSSLSTLEPIELNKALPSVFWQMKGQGLLKLNKVNDAAEHYETWLNYSPLNKDALLGVLLTKDVRQDYQSALTATELYLAQRKDYQVDIFAAYFNVMLNNVDKTRTIINQLPSDAQGLPFVRGIKARLALFDNRFADAIDDARVAYNDRKTIRSLLVLVRSLDGLGKVDESFNTITDYTQLYPKDQRAKLLLAERLIAKDKAAAIQEYASSLEKLPNNFVALNNLAYLYFDDNQLDKALPLAQKAVDMRPSSPEAVDTLGQIYLAQGEIKKARALYDTITNQDNISDEVSLHYIELLMKMGDEQRAQRRFTDTSWTLPEMQQRAQSALNGQ